MDQQAYNQSRPYGRPPLRRKALLIGINYEGQKAALQGCRQDVRNSTSTKACNFGILAYIPSSGAYS